MSKGTVTISIEHYDELRKLRDDFYENGIERDGGVIKMKKGNGYVKRDFEYVGDEPIYEYIIEELKDREDTIKRMSKLINTEGLFQFIKRRLFFT